MSLSSRANFSRAVLICFMGKNYGFFGFPALYRFLSHRSFSLLSFRGRRKVPAFAVVRVRPPASFTRQHTHKILFAVVRSEYFLLILTTYDYDPSSSLAIFLVDMPSGSTPSIYVAARSLIRSSRLKRKSSSTHKQRKLCTCERKIWIERI